MRKRLAFALFWLLLVALPMQGFTAATMLFCGLPDRANDAPAATHAHHSGEHIGHQHDHGKGGHSGHADTCVKCMTCCNATISPPVIATLEQSGPGLPPSAADPLPPVYPDMRGPYHPPKPPLA